MKEVAVFARVWRIVLLVIDDVLQDGLGRSGGIERCTKIEDVAGELWIVVELFHGRIQYYFWQGTRERWSRL